MRGIFGIVASMAAGAAAAEVPEAVTAELSDMASAAVTIAAAVLAALVAVWGVKLMRHAIGDPKSGGGDVWDPEIDWRDASNHDDHVWRYKTYRDFGV